MFKFVRAGGVAAVAFVGATILGAGPSQAVDVGASIPSSVAVHETAGVQATGLMSSSLGDDPANLQIALPIQLETPAGVSVDHATIAVDGTISVEGAADASPPPAPPVVAKSEPRTLTQMVSDYRSATVPDRERECLAGAIYFEAKGEPLSGQIAVGQVIANRAKSGRFPTSWCGVVFQRSQFSFVRGGGLPPIPRGSLNWKTAVAVAHIVANGMQESIVPRALFFHARSVAPGWKRVSKIATVGNHIFYR